VASADPLTNAGGSLISSVSWIGGFGMGSGPSRRYALLAARQVALLLRTQKTVQQLGTRCHLGGGRHTMVRSNCAVIPIASVTPTLTVVPLTLGPVPEPGPGVPLMSP
jgi:hypothetical protein